MTYYKGLRKEEYDFYKSIGICVRCHKNSAEPNKSMCIECADKEAEYNRNKRNRKPISIKAKDLDKYYRLKEAGICTYCKHEQAISGKTKCSKCLAKIRRKRDEKRQELYRSEWVSYGICYLCGKNPVMKGKGVCEKCYEVRLEAINKCIKNRRQDFNKCWKNENKLLFKKGKEAKYDKARDK